MHNYYPNTPETITAALDVLKDEMLKEDLKHIRIEAAAEHLIDADFEVILEQNTVMPIQKMYLLIEMSYLQPPLNFEEAVSKTASKRFFPILAHPERYHFLHHKPKKYTKFKSQGLLFQMNMLSLSSYYGKEVQKAAFKLLEDGQIDFVGSDVHHITQLEAVKNITLSKKTLNQILPVISNTIEIFF